MTGDLLMRTLCVVYVAIALVFAHEGHWAKMWYWLAAAQITASVLLMK